jgi:hypothetical protein
MNRAFATITATALALACIFMAVPCMASTVMKIVPPQIELKKTSTEAAEKWSFFVRDVTDARPGNVAATKTIGTADQRFSDDDATIELDREPTVFIREQVGRFLLLRGMEASSTERAKVFIDISLERFEVVRDSKSLAEKTTFYLGFSARFFTNGGDELGTVALAKNQWTKKVTPFGGEKALGELITNALVGALTSMEKSDIYLLAAEK